MQWRKGYITEDGRVFEPRLDLRMKTAIDRASRRSAEAMLFGYESIPSGSKFLFKVQADEKEDLERVDALLSEHEIRLGKSRSAEYGDVRVERIDIPAGSQPEEAVGLIALYLASDLALERNGMPVLRPVAEDFGLANAELIPDKYFLRMRSYSPWNSFFNCRMPERQVLCRGGVIAFQTNADCGLNDLQNRLSKGIGLHREEGLGQVLVNPKWILHPPALHELAGASDSAARADAPLSTLAAFLRGETTRREESAEAFKGGLAWAKEWIKLSRKIEDAGQQSPGKSQWAAVRELAVRLQKDPGSLTSRLELLCTHSLSRKTWSEAAIRVKGQSRSMLGAVQDKIGRTPDRSTCLKLYHASVEMGRLLSRKKAENMKE